MLLQVWHVILGAVGILDTLVVLTFLPWIVLSKRDTTAAVAWCLIVCLVPLLGGALWVFIGYNWMGRRRLRKRQRHREQFTTHHPPLNPASVQGGGAPVEEDDEDDLGRLARQVGSFGVVPGNAVTLYHKTALALEAILDAVAQAKHHIHLEFFIVRDDNTGRRVMAALERKAREGVEVRLLFDKVGCLRTNPRLYDGLRAAGGKVHAFMNISWLWALFQINLRNHRKLVIVDGRVGFTGGMNIGDEYLGEVPRFGYWRDSFVRVEGPAVASMQRIFAVDWAFACGEEVNREPYFPTVPAAGKYAVQVVEAGPDQAHPAIRDVFFAAIVEARERVWIATPYFVPDAGLLDALRLARHRHVDVRVLWLLNYDKRIPYYAAFYYWPELLKLGVRVYQYNKDKKAMMHAKVMVVDNDWAFVGSANFDNRSLHLSFEVGCIVFARELIDELTGQFEIDFATSEELTSESLKLQPWPTKLEENAYRLLSPLL